MPQSASSQTARAHSPAVTGGEVSSISDWESTRLSDISDAWAGGVYATVHRWVTRPQPSLIVKGFAEFMACMLFHFIGSVCATAAANGVVLMVLVYYTAKMSGAHLNPAVSFTFTLLGHTNPVEMLVYWVAQLAGCVVGALWLAALVPGLHIGAQVTSYRSGAALDNLLAGPADGCFLPDGELTNAQIWGWEAAGTFCFLVPIFSVVWYTQHKSGYGNTGPIMVGLSLYAAAMATGPWTGAALNPARVLASPIVFRCPRPQTLLYYVLGQLTGAFCVPVAIVPWYGISGAPWYRLPQRTIDNMVTITPRDARVTMDGIRAVTRGTSFVHRSMTKDSARVSLDLRTAMTMSRNVPPRERTNAQIEGVGGSPDRSTPDTMVTSVQVPSSNEAVYMCANPFARISHRAHTTTLPQDDNMFTSLRIMPQTTQTLQTRGRSPTFSPRQTSNTQNNNGMPNRSSLPGVCETTTDITPEVTIETTKYPTHTPPHTHTTHTHNTRYTTHDTH
jgi:glycerol uptake facilitator-like aquaporin